MSVLIIDLGDLKSGSALVNGRIKPEELSFQSGSEYVFSGAVSLNLRISSTDNLIFYVSGEVSYKASGECRRCLKKVERKASSEVKGVFALPEALEKVSFGREDKKADEIVPLKSGENFIDLTALVRESIVLDFPRYLLCKEDCKGLCPGCGADLNIQGCKCQHNKIDSRWAKLRELG